MDKRLALLIGLSLFSLIVVSYTVMKGGYFHVTHNIAVTSSSVSKSTVYAGDIVVIRVTIKNKGDVTESFNVTCFYNTTTLETQMITDLAAGADTSLIFSWDTTDISPASYVIRVEADIMPGETNITDNTYVAGTVVVKAKATLYVTPQESMVTVGESFTVNITISNVANLYGFEFELKYNSTVLNILNITEGGFLKQGGETLFYPEINNIQGYAYVVSLLLGDIPGVNGIGTLATITFEAIGEGASLIDLYNTKLRDPQPKPIPHTTIDGSVEV